MDAEAAVVLCDVSGLARVDVGAVDMLARIQLVARERGAQVVLHRSPPALVDLVDLIGLAEALPSCCSGVEAQGEPEHRVHALGVQEEADPDDLIT